MKRIYLDNNATTPVEPAVRDAMLPYLEGVFGNPASGHRFGEEARAGLDRAREQVAGLINGRPGRVILNSGGTEANNAALFSAVWANPAKKHLISSQVEHASVLTPLRFLQTLGYEVELLPVDSRGGLDLERLAAAIRPDTALVSLMGANNETGVLWPVAEIGEICERQGALFHCDAIQLAGKVEIDVATLPVDYLTLASHKLHGPKGSGALYAKHTAPVSPMVLGAGQEEGRRAGTENMPGIVGFGLACELAGREAGFYRERLRPLRDKMERFILENIPAARVNGQGLPRLANTLNVSFEQCSSAALIQDLDEKGLSVSAHSACQSGDLDPSHVLAAMAVPETYRHGTLRISLSRLNTEEEVDALLDVLPGVVAGSRQGFAL